MENVCSLRLCPVSPAVAVAGMPRTVPTLPSVKLYLGAVVSSKQDNQFLFLPFGGGCMPIDLYARKIVVHSLPSSGVFAFSPPSQGRPLLLPPSQHLRQHGFRWPAPTRCPDVRLFQLLALRRSVPRVMSSSMFVWQYWTLSVDYHVAPATGPAPWMTAPSSVGRHTGSPHGTGSACFDEAARRQLGPRATLPMLAAGPWEGDGCPWTL